MLGLKQEALLFLHAVLIGVIGLGTYLCLQIIRKLIPHHKWVIQLEDLVYWVVMTAYLFVQVYRVNRGKIRWYSVLGIVIGGGILWIIFSIFRKIVDKIYVKIKKKYRKSY